MAESALNRTPGLSWPRTGVVAVDTCMNEPVARAAGDAKGRAACEGLLDLLDLSRRQATRFRRDTGNRRTGADRRQ